MSQSGGFVRVESEPGRGSTFHLYFPAATAGPGEAAAISDLRPPDEAPIVLLAEDEDLVRDLVSSVLEREGFEVHAAKNGLEALEQLDAVDRPVDLLVTDLVMPTMSGRELAARVVEREPQAQDRLHLGLFRGVAGPRARRRPSAPVFVRKPFSPRALAETVNRVVARPRGGNGVAPGRQSIPPS